ncbi:MAG: P-loop NTPase [Candidatus Woesearchaeota archaeon]
MGLPLFKENKQETQVDDPINQEKKRLYEAIKHIPHRIGVHAGKGGVGKTFLTTQLALLYAQQGLRVGILDADVDCPNIPSAYNLEEDMLIDEDNKLIPVEYRGVKVASTGFMQKNDESLIIRGPIKHRLLTDFIEKTAWGELDVLLFDFPPGTSDVPLSAMQVANLTGLVLITTPQKEALQDCRRAIHMTRKIGTPILGLVENMAGPVFGEKKVQQLAEELELDLLASIPLSQETREKAERGELALTNTDIWTSLYQN